MPLLQAQPASTVSPPRERSDLQGDIAGSLAPHHDLVSQGILDEIKLQNEEQLSFQRSSHELIVDLSSRVRQIIDEASSRERRSVLLDLVLLYDSLEQVLGWTTDTNDPRPKEAIADRLETLRIELLEILMRRDVRIFDGVHEVLDRRLHRAIRTVPTSDPSLNDKVKTVVRTGFFWREQVLRPEEVIIFKHKPDLLEES